MSNDLTNGGAPAPEAAPADPVDAAAAGGARVQYLAEQSDRLVTQLLTPAFDAVPGEERAVLSGAIVALTRFAMEYCFPPPQLITVRDVMGLFIGPINRAAEQLLATFRSTSG